MIEPVPPVAGLRDLVDRYDAIISDVWGVLHNGVAATPGAAPALTAARAAGLPVVLLTNAPRPPDSIRAQLREFGITDAAYDAIVSSGGVARELIAAEGDAPFFHLGPARDRPVYAGLTARPAPLEAARFILCTGLFDDEREQAESYRPLLEAAQQRGLRLLCANPDLLVERGTRLIPCAGAVAALYESLGGETIWIGKPKPLVYAAARQALAGIAGREIPPHRILCIGDAFRTDIAGAGGAGHDSLMILAGIHGHEIGLAQDGSYDPAAFARLSAENAARPTMSMVSLVW
jgi:HAD superfamily hydrolase (TIGR01459 family)